MNNKTTSEQCVDVVIAGLGPTGLTLAHVLGRQGHSVVVLEREPAFYGNARAVYTDDECMRIFQSIGLADELQEKMLLETPVQFVRPDGEVLGQYMPLGRPYGWPVVNFFYQPYLETTMTETLSRYESVSVRRGREVVDFSQDSTGVTICHQATQQYRFSDECDAKEQGDGNLDPKTLRARYFIGADGGRSIVRTKLGIDMTGRNFPEPWLVVDLKQKDASDGIRHLPYFNFVINRELPVVSCTQPDGYHRFEFMLMPGVTKEHMEKPETIRELLSRYVDPDKFVVQRKLVYTFNALIANEWSRGRIFLAGDAAHMTPQFMGQGASAGFRDAANLGWKLSAVLNGHANPSLLDSYEKERRGHVKSMIDRTVLLKTIVSMTNPVGTILRDAFFKTSQVVPPLKQWLVNGEFKPRPVYATGKYCGLKRLHRKSPEGSLSPQPEVRRFDGQRVLLDSVLGDDFAVIGYGVDPRVMLSSASRLYLEKLGVKYVTLYPYGGRPQGQKDVERSYSDECVEVEDVSGNMVTWFENANCKHKGIAILRPDRFTFGVVKCSDADQAVAMLKKQLG